MITHDSVPCHYTGVTLIVYYYLMRPILTFFDKLEDYIREHLSRYPIPYAIISGITVVLFWRGVWETADMLSRVNPFLHVLFYPPLQIALSVSGLLLTGLLVSVFIGDRIIISGLKKEKKLEERTEELVEQEEITLTHLRNEIRALRKDIEEMKK